jgi:hypothetical protein
MRKISDRALPTSKGRQFIGTVYLLRPAHDAAVVTFLSFF